MMSRKEEIAQNLSHVRERIENSARSVGRKSSEIELIAVTKTFPISDAVLLCELGFTQFGENRDSEGAAKSTQVSGHWHFQGQIQSKKLKSITAWASFIHSLDSLEHCEKIAGLCAQRVADPLGIFIQVSLDGAEGRGGVLPKFLPPLADCVLKSPGLKLMGLMAVAPLGVEPDSAFEQLAVIHNDFSGRYPQAKALSAGMSNDYESAIHHGATHIRLGSSILGSRTPAL